jgi:hypothetical protein
MVPTQAVRIRVLRAFNIFVSMPAGLPCQRSGSEFIERAAQNAEAIGGGCRKTVS